MHPITPLGNYLFTSLLAGLFGALAMEAVMWAISRAEWAKANMIVAIGSLVTRKREGSWTVGVLLHSVSAFGFALIYVYAMTRLGLTQFPIAVIAGTGFGVLHGMVVSLLLVWLVAERHPLKEFQEAGMAVGLSHLAGHIAYGAAVGLVVGIGSLA